MRGGKEPKKGGRREGRKGRAERSQGWSFAADLLLGMLKKSTGCGSDDSDTGPGGALPTVTWEHPSSGPLLLSKRDDVKNSSPSSFDGKCGAGSPRRRPCKQEHHSGGRSSPLFFSLCLGERAPGGAGLCLRLRTGLPPDLVFCEEVFVGTRWVCPPTSLMSGILIRVLML